MTPTPLQQTSSAVRISINADERAKIARSLSGLLADTYFLYLKSHQFHWNVTGPQFPVLHALFETHYRALFEALDAIAERIRALGHYAPGTHREFTALSSMREDTMPMKAEDMIRRLVESHEAATRAAHQAFEIADAANDQPTADLLTQRMEEHEKTAWMLRSMLET